MVCEVNTEMAKKKTPGPDDKEPGAVACGWVSRLVMLEI